jgi:hypothetical protein
MLVENARREGTRGREFLLKLWAVTTCEERMAIEKETNQIETEEYA